MRTGSESLDELVISRITGIESPSTVERKRLIFFVFLILLLVAFWTLANREDNPNKNPDLVGPPVPKHSFVGQQNPLSYHGVENKFAQIGVSNADGVFCDYGSTAIVAVTRNVDATLLSTIQFKTPLTFHLAPITKIYGKINATVIPPPGQSSALVWSTVPGEAIPFSFDSADTNNLLYMPGIGFGGTFVIEPKKTNPNNIKWVAATMPIYPSTDNVVYPVGNIPAFEEESPSICNATDPQKQFLDYQNSIDGAFPAYENTLFASPLMFTYDPEIYHMDVSVMLENGQRPTFLGVGPEIRDNAYKPVAIANGKESGTAYDRAIPCIAFVGSLNEFKLVTVHPETSQKLYLAYF